jgi:hypothetical protein
LIEFLVCEPSALNQNPSEPPQLTCANDSLRIDTRQNARQTNTAAKFEDFLVGKHVAVAQDEIID